MSQVTHYVSIPHNTDNNTFGEIASGQTNESSAAKIKQQFLKFCKEGYAFLNSAERNIQKFDRLYVLFEDTIYLVAKTNPKPVKVTGDYAKAAKRAIRARLTDIHSPEHALEALAQSSRKGDE